MRAAGIIAVDAAPENVSFVAFFRVPYRLSRPPPLSGFATATAATTWLTTDER
jgi:hypothetical protein